MGLPLDWRTDPVVQLENLVFPVLTGAVSAALGGADPQWSTVVHRLTQLLRAGCDPLLEPAGFLLGTEERRKCNEAATALERFLLLLDAPDPQQDTVLNNFQSEVMPSLTRALDAVRSVFIGGVLVRQAQHANNTARALKELETISKTILFISINASIEAARAGEAGRGFTAIAEDIRTLARNAQSTIERIDAA